MKNPNCSLCGCHTTEVEDEGYECNYCGTLLDSNGDVIYEIKSM